MFQGKRKAVTFSYDDGVTQDIRLIELFNRYGLKATFNLNSGRLGEAGMLVREGVTVSHTKNGPADVKHIYAEHEVAAHTLTHPLLTSVAEDGEIIRQVEADRLRLSELVGYEVLGMAYPGGGPNHDARVVRLVREHTGIQYARSVETTGGFGLPEDLYQVQGLSLIHI